MEGAFSFHIFSQKKCFFAITFQHEKNGSIITLHLLCPMRKLAMTCSLQIQSYTKWDEKIWLQIHLANHSNMTFQRDLVNLRITLFQSPSQDTAVKYIFLAHRTVLQVLLFFSFKMLILLINCYLTMPMFRNIQDSIELKAFMNKN